MDINGAVGGHVVHLLGRPGGEQLAKEGTCQKALDETFLETKCWRSIDSPEHRDEGHHGCQD